MFESINTMPLTLVADYSTTQADSLRPKEYRFSNYNLTTLFLLDLCNSCQLKETASLNYRFICGKSRASTLKLACLFNTARWVVNQIYYNLETHTVVVFEAYLHAQIVYLFAYVSRAFHPDADLSTGTARDFPSNS
jgi:hypothetical protein